MTLTQHAAVRRQQRCIPQLVLDLLEQFGSHEQSGPGVMKLFFDKAARQRIRAYAGPLVQSIEEYLDVYAVVTNDDIVITAGYRNKRIQRH